MSREGPWQKLARFETHHEILAFAVVLVGTIVLSRLLVLIYNPNPVLFNLELHHFDYGVILLLLTTNLLLFGPRRYRALCLFLAAVASGLILDEYLFIREGVVRGSEDITLYNATLPEVAVIVVVVSLTLLLVNALLRRYKVK